MKFRIRTLICVLFPTIFFLLSSCTNETKQKQDTTQSSQESETKISNESNLPAGTTDRTSPTITLVSLAPFDRYPGDDKFPLVFRFSAPVAPVDRYNKDNFASLSISPSRYGTWSWVSDSQLNFTPKEAWEIAETLQVSLKGLVTSDGLLRNSPKISPEDFTISLPPLTTSLESCALYIINRAPLVQAPNIKLRFNYPVNTATVLEFSTLLLITGQNTESLKLNYGYSGSEMHVYLDGSQLFRPDDKAKIEYSLVSGVTAKNSAARAPSVECEIEIAPNTWDELAENEKKKVPAKPLVELSVQNLYSQDSNTNRREPLTLKFTKPFTQGSEQPVAHGRQKGITLNQGISLNPSISGIWKASESQESQLIFTPNENWVIGTKYSLNIDPTIFPDVTFKNTEVSFITPKLEAGFSETKLFSDPENPENRVISAILEFSDAPRLTDLEKSLSIKMRVEPNKTFLGSGVRTIKFSLTPDKKFPNKIYILSEKINLPDEPGEVSLQLSRGVQAEVGGAPNELGAVNLLSIPSKKEIFKVISASTSIVKNNKEELERILSIELSENTNPNDLLNNTELYLLPDCKAEQNSKLCRKQLEIGSEAKVYADVLAKAEKITLSLVPSDEATIPNVFNFSYEVPENRELFVKVNKGLTSKTQFSLAKDYRLVFFAQEFPRKLSIMHDGALLSLSGDKKLGIMARGVNDLEFELARILPRDVHHLVSTTYGNFARPYFNDSYVGLDQISERFTYWENLPKADNQLADGKTRYTTVDFGKFRAKGTGPKEVPPFGLFILKVNEKVKENSEDNTTASDEGSEEYSEEEEGEAEGEGEYEENSAALSDQRLVLLTDLGLLVKDSLDNQHDIFVMSFRTGEPVAGAEVKLLGQNGEALFSKITDVSGHVTFPPTNELKREKVPLVYTVQKGADYSFLPFARGDRRLNLSRFDTGGVVNSEEAEGLRALVFSDRGIYRPGEDSKFGIIVRKRNLEPASSALPLEMSIRDPRGVEVLSRKFSLSKLGFEDFHWSTQNALTGTYTLNVSLIRKDRQDERALLGSTTFRVDEFQPDKLAVKAKFQNVTASTSATVGWSKLNGNFNVNVQNLFGTPAVDNKVKGTLLARPWIGTFSAYPDYQFYSAKETERIAEKTEDLGEQQTSSQGEVSFNPDLARFAESAMDLQFAAEAFEKDSGRSIVATTQALVSEAPYFIGWKSDGSLDYISKGAERKISLLAVNPDLEAISLEKIKLELFQTKMISSLVKLPSGALEYQLTPKISSVSSEEITLEQNNTEIELKTEEPGDYTLKFFNEKNQEINSLRYVVHGEGNDTFMTDRSAEVGIRLNKTQLEPGEELEISLNTPYVGSGLITIERDKVYASKWFKSETRSSTQKITIPAGIIGNAYVAVTFVRSLSSPDIFAAPLSYGAKPFYIAKSAYTSSINLSAPEKIKPGTELSVKYSLNNTGKFLLYAVDEGILQFARYKTPDPVGSFVPKRALEVNTFQILDLLLPDHSVVESLSSPGGDEDVNLGKFKNPFARRRRAPMAFWSGVIVADKLTGEVKIPVPEYFNGTIKLIALLVSDKKLGVDSTKVVAQSDFVIDPQAPYFVSPGDEFEIGATVANTVKDSGNSVMLDINILTNSGLELLENKPIKLNVPEGQDKSFRVKLKAKDELGEKNFTIKVAGLGKDAKAEESISVRPPQALRTTLQAGVYRKDKDGDVPEKTLSLTRELYSEKREVLSSISASPLSMARALVSYLKEYPYGCTEQLVSSAFPAILFGTNPELNLSEADVTKYSRRALAALNSRQRADGSFGLWDANSEPDLLFSVYATHFLMEAAERGVEINSGIYSDAKNWLRNLLSTVKYTINEQLAQSYALYVLARSGEVVTNQAETLVLELDRQWGRDKWKNTAISLFLAGTFKILQMESKANEFLANPPKIWDSSRVWPLSDAALYYSIYSWISAKHFSKDKWLSELDSVLPVGAMIENQEFNSFNASFAVLGLEALSKRYTEESFTKDLKISSIGENNSKNIIPTTGNQILRALIPEGIKKLMFEGSSDKMFFYELTETGFDRNKASTQKSGFSIVRELKNEKNEAGDSIGLENKLEVTMFIKADRALSDIAILELVPGGFEIDLSDAGLDQRRSLKPGVNTWSPQFIDIQEDRLIFFGDLPQDTVTFTYRLKPLSRGKFTFAAPYGEGMYDSKVGFVGEQSLVEVR